MRHEISCSGADGFISVEMCSEQTSGNDGAGRQNIRGVVCREGGVGDAWSAKLCIFHFN